VVVGGIHGNEPAGVRAAQRVLESLRRDHLHLRGRLAAVSGNRAALASGVRYIHRDLNRRWSTEDLRRIRSAPHSPACSEDREQDELDATLETFFREGRAAGCPVVLLDLHTTSGDGSPFTACSDTPINRRLALDLPVPLILRLAETLDGPMLNHFAHLGHPCIVVEGGSHDGPSSVERLETAIWILLTTMGCIDSSEVPGFKEKRDAFARATGNLPRAVEIFHRHPVVPGDGFVMEPGFRNFQPVQAGQLLARDRSGPIHASRDSHLLMPLYQGLGDDGFFLARDVTG
jgi:succinylglutamate desuccinylase